MITKATKNANDLMFAIYDYIVEYIGENGKSPHIIEIANEFRISRVTASNYVKRLSNLGKIEYTDRNIHITERSIK